MTKIYVATIEDLADFGKVLERHWHWDKQWLEERLDIRVEAMKVKWVEDNPTEDPVYFAPKWSVDEVSMIQSYWQLRPDEEQKTAMTCMDMVARDTHEDLAELELDKLGRQDYHDFMGINEDGSLKHPQT